MVGAIYASMIGGSIVRGPENTARNTVRDSSHDPKKVKAVAEIRSGAFSAAGNGAKTASSGYGSQEVNTLFSEVEQTGSIQEMPRMIVGQRAYEAALRTFEAEDEVVGETLSLIA